MQARMKNPAIVLPDAMTGIQHLYKAMGQGGVAQATLDLVHLRVSQINGCSACVHVGVRNARAAGETEDRLLQVAAWRETDLFTPAERAALALSEAATRLADGAAAVTDELWAAATEHFDEEGLAAIVLMIGLTNLFNRLNTTIREPAGAIWS
jgi:AhpD family alkylhydroperoxidase